MRTAEQQTLRPDVYNQLVSLIVPIYEAEEYLSECISSLLAQTHENIEIILVDDGSTDKSGQIIDQFCELDNRVKALHKENMGVSAARNSGLDIVKGQYVSFVDADDWLSPKFVETFLGVALKHQAEFVLSRNILASPNLPDLEDNTEEIISSDQAVAEIFYAEMKIGCWNKLYKVSMLKDHKIEFDDQFFMGEGLKFITTVSKLSAKILVISASHYFYRMDNANSATTVVSIRKMKNAIAAIDSITSMLGDVGESAKTAISFHKWHTVFFALVAFRDKGSPTEELKFYNECKAYLKKFSFRLLLLAKISSKRRILVLANFLSSALAVKVYRTLRNHGRS